MVPQLEFYLFPRCRISATMRCLIATPCKRTGRRERQNHPPKFIRATSTTALIIPQGYILHLEFIMEISKKLTKEFCWSNHFRLKRSWADGTMTLSSGMNTGGGCWHHRTGEGRARVEGQGTWMRKQLPSMPQRLNCPTDTGNGLTSSRFCNLSSRS